MHKYHRESLHTFCPASPGDTGYHRTWSKPGNWQQYSNSNLATDLTQLSLVLTCTFCGCRVLWHFITYVDSCDHCQNPDVPSPPRVLSSFELDLNCTSQCTFISDFFHWTLCSCSLFILIVLFHCMPISQLFTCSTAGGHFGSCNFCMFWTFRCKHVCQRYTEEWDWWVLGCVYVYLWDIVKVYFPKWFH